MDCNVIPFPRNLPSYFPIYSIFPEISELEEFSLI